MSSSFWTPVSVATRAAELLVRCASTRVLDVGSGAGKFCIVGAAVTGAIFVGIERWAPLVHTARSATERLGIDRASFLHGPFHTVDTTDFDAIYFFNPFERGAWTDRQLDDAVHRSDARFITDIDRAEQLLRGARLGTRVVTYHGFGGEMPPEYRRERRERHHTGYLELWVKTGGLPSQHLRLHDEFIHLRDVNRTEPDAVAR
jgi:SAM-dependent methyltransferase